VVVEGDDTLARPRQVGDDEVNRRPKLTRMPLDFGHHSAGFLPALHLIAEARIVAAHLKRRSTDGSGEQPILPCKMLSVGSHLEAAHLAGRGGCSLNRPVTNHPAHRRIAAQPIRVVHFLVAGEPAEHRLAQQADQWVATVLPGARIGERVGARVRQTHRVVQLA